MPTMRVSSVVLHPLKILMLSDSCHILNHTFPMDGESPSNVRSNKKMGIMSEINSPSCSQNVADAAATRCFSFHLGSILSIYTLE